MKNHLQQLSIHQLTILRANLKIQILDDLFGEEPELRMEFKDINESIYIKKIDAVIETKDLKEMEDVYIEVKEAFSRINSKHISLELVMEYQKLSTLVTLMNNENLQGTEFLKKLLNGDIPLNLI